MNKDFIDFSLAVKLKEKGFREECIATYDIKDREFDFNNIFSVWRQINVTAKNCLMVFNDSNCGLIDAPTTQVLKWLRKKYSIHISTKPYPCEDRVMWMYEIRKFSKYISAVVKNKTRFVEEEDAELAGIKYVLENLI